jgi:hypothetical protein
MPGFPGIVAIEFAPTAQAVCKQILRANESHIVEAPPAGSRDAKTAWRCTSDLLAADHATPSCRLLAAPTPHYEWGTGQRAQILVVTTIRSQS